MNIPMELIRPIVRDYLERSDGEDVRMMERRCGLGNGYLSHMLGGTTVNRDGSPQDKMEQETVDRILCKMGDPLKYWLNPPLDYYYWNGDIPPDPSKPIRCARKGCENWIEMTYFNNGKGETLNNTKYCSTACKAKVARTVYYRKPKGKATRQRSVIQKRKFKGHEVECRWCGKPFVAKTGLDKYCKDQCRKDRNAAALREKRRKSGSR